MSELDVKDADRFVHEAQQIALALNLNRKMEPRMFGLCGYPTPPIWGFETQGMWDYWIKDRQKLPHFAIRFHPPYDTTDISLSYRRRSFHVELKSGVASWEITEEFIPSKLLVLLMASALFKLNYDISSLDKHFSLKITPREKMQWLLEMEGARIRSSKNARKNGSRINSHLDVC